MLNMETLNPFIGGQVQLINPTGMNSEESAVAEITGFQMDSCLTILIKQCRETKNGDNYIACGDRFLATGFIERQCAVEMQPDGTLKIAEIYSGRTFLFLPPNHPRRIQFTTEN